MLVKHVKCFDVHGNLQPFATVVATGAGKIGLSICHDGEKFNKEMGVNLAAGRAVTGTETKIPQGTVMTRELIIPIKQLLEMEINSMKARSVRYFKNST